MTFKDDAQLQATLKNIALQISNLGNAGALDEAGVEIGAIENLAKEVHIGCSDIVGAIEELTSVLKEWREDVTL